MTKAGPRAADRLWAVVAADFDRRVCTRRKIAAWCAFWGEAKSRPTYQALCGAREEGSGGRTGGLGGPLRRVRAGAGQLEERNWGRGGPNRQLRDLERLKSDLLNRIAHELNTPVTAIQTAGRILGRYEEMPADRAGKFVEIITQESTRLADLIASSLQAAVLGVTAAFHEPGRRRPVHEFHRTVVTQQQVTSQIADCRILAAAVTLDGDQ